MPDFEDGFKALAFGLISGLVLSVIVSSFFGETWGFLFSLASILIGIIQLERAKYWGLTYALGYFGGLALFGSFFMENWEYPIYIFIVGGFIAQKIVRKLR